MPERLDHFMARAAAAYYAGRDPFGARGDFITAPEISQAFGECLGLWAAIAWQVMGKPAPVLLVELGPGRGTLMADALRAIAQVVPDFRAALRLHLVEQSPALRARQAELLAGAEPVWHDRVEDLPPGPALVLANEFLDALPIRQFERRGGAWLERHVEAGAFVPVPVSDDAPPLPGGAPEGAIQEVCEPARVLAAHLGARLAAQGGAALFVDYGPARSGFGDSLQALSAHGAADPLGAPGAADITAHVDFQAVAEAGIAAGATAQGPVPQGIFLQSLGLVTRAAMLARARPSGAGMQLSAAQRLIAPEGMGRLFKALALCHPALPTLPGFETA
ncbi:class I SAM-dependent methyltransferase [Pseudoroseomonas cervicalis]|uniref:class I SAM-dependent methyltransferase n=1 Tax=Teichococcus cervicalis TaxID=204525 RepID=UPI0027857095|nr:SAM-dependent methyltransferase [Pseudoroseomonas cervicalis]MDQ1078319.1 NADH dehydrogenase [ubiquinone] 1 alpha subcomplex assembly factor 7 [Pseudoroseomonas cervicalis]